jgi:hypothetical protein
MYITCWTCSSQLKYRPFHRSLQSGLAITNSTASSNAMSRKYAECPQRVERTVSADDTVVLLCCSWQVTLSPISTIRPTGFWRRGFHPVPINHLPSAARNRASSSHGILRPSCFSHRHHHRHHLIEGTGSEEIERPTWWTWMVISDRTV